MEEEKRRDEKREEEEEEGKAREENICATGLRFIFTTLLIAFLYPLEFVLTLNIFNWLYYSQIVWPIYVVQ